jgi:hypothetical protein
VEEKTGLSRRRVIAGATAAGVATVIGASLAFAQDATPTPSTSTGGSGTPAAGSSSTTNGTSDQSSTILQRVDDAIASAKADRDSVSSSADLTVVDQLLTQASAFRDKAATGTDDAQTQRYARAAFESADAATDLITAQLSAFGLPSEKTRVGEILTRAHDEIQQISTNVGASTDTDVKTNVSTAQSLYSKAYDLYNAGTYAEAGGTARAAVSVGKIAEILTSTGNGVGGFGGPGGHNDHGGQFNGRGQIGRRGNAEQGNNRQNDQEDSLKPSNGTSETEPSSTPAAVPSPTF